jgi:uncharacterized protein (DUF427 family)
VLHSVTYLAIREGVMFRAVWNGAVLAESDHTVKVEGNHYFPPESLHQEHFTDSTATSTCPWKGRASYYHVSVDGKINQNAAWYYPQPRPAASKIAGHVAFWNGVRVQRVPGPAWQPGKGAGRDLAGRIVARLHLAEMRS